MPDPCHAAFGNCVRIQDDGQIESLNQTGELLIDLLRLNRREVVAYRKLIIDTLTILREKAPDVYLQWVRFPDDLEDLSLKRPPGGNSRPAGVNESWFAKRQRGELPGSY